MLGVVVFVDFVLGVCLWMWVLLLDFLSLGVCCGLCEYLWFDVSRRVVGLCFDVLWVGGFWLGFGFVGLVVVGFWVYC